MKKITFVIFVIFINYFGYSQVVFNSMPEEKQLIGRDISTNKGLIKISGEVNNGPNYDIAYTNWKSGEPNNSPAPENVGEMFGSNTVFEGQWNDGSANDTKYSYVEFEGEINTLANLIYLGQYNGHSYFKNPNNLSWQDAKIVAENLGGYLSSHQTLEENNAVAAMGDFLGWIGLYQDLNSPNYEEPSGGWKWVASSNVNSNFSSIYVEIYKNNVFLETFTQNLTFNNDLANFDFDINLNQFFSIYLKFQILTQ